MSEHERGNPQQEEETSNPRKEAMEYIQKRLQYMIDNGDDEVPGFPYVVGTSADKAMKYLKSILEALKSGNALPYVLLRLHMLEELVDEGEYQKNIDIQKGRNKVTNPQAEVLGHIDQLIKEIARLNGSDDLWNNEVCQSLPDDFEIMSYDPVTTD